MEKITIADIQRNLSPYLKLINKTFDNYVKREIDHKAYLLTLATIEAKCNDAIKASYKLKSQKGAFLLRGALQEFISGIEILKQYVIGPIDFESLNAHLAEANRLLVEFGEASA